MDRLYSLYQATNPGVYLTPGPSGLTTLQLPAGTIADLNTPLFPFRDGSGNEWTSEAIKDLDDMYQFGYSYPETPADLSGDDLSAFAARQINELYAPNTNDESFVEDSAGDSEALAEAQRKFRPTMGHFRTYHVLTDMFQQNQMLVLNGAATLSMIRRICQALISSTSILMTAVATVTSLRMAASHNQAPSTT